MLTAPKRTARQPKRTRISAALASRVRLHGPLDYRDHGNALVESKRADPFIEFRKHLEIELHSLGCRPLLTTVDEAPVGSGKRSGLPLAPTGNGGRSRTLTEPLQDQHVLAFKVAHDVAFSEMRLTSAAQSASISVRATLPFSTSGPLLPTVMAAM